MDREHMLRILEDIYGEIEEGDAHLINYQRNFSGSGELEEVLTLVRKPSNVSMTPTPPTPPNHTHTVNTASSTYHNHTATTGVFTLDEIREGLGGFST